MTKTFKTLATLGVVAGLGIASLPFAGASAAEVSSNTADDPITDTSKTSVNTNFTLTLKDKLSITASEGDVVLAESTDETEKEKGIYSAGLTVTVETGNAGGYNLTMAGTADAATKNGLTSENGVVINTGTLGDSDTNSSWGFKAALGTGSVDTLELGTDITVGSWNGIGLEAAPNTIMTNTKPTKGNGDVANLTFGAKIVDGQAAGTYKGKVTFTATNQPVATEEGTD